MSYYLAKRLALPFADALERTRNALKEAGFGIIAEIDIAATLRQKLGVDFRKYRILGACNPALAYEALGIEDKVGTLLPCNVVVQEIDAGESEVAAIDPVAAMQAVANPQLAELAARVRALLEQVVARL
jgi:uncharacterized protein (DUF302 family)